MNQIKPYLFWIVLGSVLLLELGWWLLSIPDIDVVGNKADALSANAKLKVDEGHLEELVKRAKRASPSGVFDAEKDADIHRLTNDYLLTPAWKSVLEPHVNRYDLQLQEIKQHLTNRSVGLSVPIAASTDKFGWYTTYQNLTEESLKRLAAAKALAIPSTPLVKAARVPPGQQAGGTATQPVAEVGPPDYANDPALRSLAGFFTKGADLPEATEHPLLTRQFRTMEQLIEIVLAVNAANDPNPLSGLSDRPEGGPAALAGVTWNPKNDQTVLGQGVNAHASAWGLTVTLQGSLSAILATTSAFEHPQGPTKPIVVVTGCEISRKPGFTAGERKDVAAEPTLARLSLLVLDFTHPFVAAATSVSGQPAGDNPVPVPVPSAAKPKPGSTGEPENAP